MRKFIVFIITAIVLMLTESVPSMGQIVPKNTWFTIELEGDELLGTSDNVAISYITDEGDKVLTYTQHPTYFIIGLGKGIFDFKVHSTRYSTHHTESVIIGYYDADGNLVDKEETTLSKLGNEYDNGVFDSEKMSDYIRNNEGYVRIVADSYRGSDFDNKIPTWKTNPPIKVKE